MKINNITIQGFRGFNEKRSIDFHDQLTLIYAPNSYGKTSVSEAFEWLLYGETSKIKKGHSKEEYKGSCRNCHLSETELSFVEGSFVNEESEIILRGELIEDDGIKRFIDGQEVEEWPFFHDPGAKSSKPFILQHDLKSLLLAKPKDRFEGFARLLGFEDLEKIQNDIVSLSTSPESNIPAEVKQFLDSILPLETRLAKQTPLNTIYRAFKKGTLGQDKTYKAILDECKRRVPLGTKEDAIFPQLLKIRKEKVSKIFKGQIILTDYSLVEKQTNSGYENAFFSFVSEEFAQKYIELVGLAAVQHIFVQAEFFNLGVKLLDKSTRKCPFCGQTIDNMIEDHVHSETERIAKAKEHHETLKKQSEELLKSLVVLDNKLNHYHGSHIKKAISFLNIEPSLNKLEKILVPKYQVHFNAVKTTIPQIKSTKEKLEASYATLVKALEDIKKSITDYEVDAIFIRNLGEALVKYIHDTQSFSQKISANVPQISDAARMLEHEIDSLADTEDISVLLELCERWNDIKKKFAVDAIIDSCKSLRKIVEQFVAKKMFDTVTDEFTADVMEWYKQIKTTGDPDVHFSQFDVPRTKTGMLRSRLVQIRATSHGKDLISAVSSLSESKLNALGLCMSIATNLKNDSIFKFLVIDDPIQSLDAEHETKFIQIIRSLADEHGKQVIILSHNKTWVDQVRSGCRTLNGRYFEVTGYNKSGPYILEKPWATYTQRLNEVNAILQNPKAGSVELQQAEEEIRLAVADITSKLYCKKIGQHKSPHNLNSQKVRSMLLKCGVESGLVDSIDQTFTMTDPAHHDSPDYAPDRNRIQCYHNWLHELAKLIN